MVRKVILVLVALVISVSLWWTISREKGGSLPSYSAPSMPLGLTGEAVALAQAGSTFPSSEARLAAYLRITPLNVEKTLTAFEDWQHYGNWVKGNAVHLAIR